MVIQWILGVSGLGGHMHTEGGWMVTWIPGVRGCDTNTDMDTGDL